MYRGLGACGAQATHVSTQVTDVAIPTPSTVGVWFVSSNLADFRLFHIGSVGGTPIKSWIIKAAPVPVGLDLGLAIDSNNDTAWIGARTTLYRLDLQGGSVTALPLPDVASSSAPKASLPTGPRGQEQTIDGVALQADGTVLVGRKAASQVQLVDRLAESASVIDLPANASVESMTNTATLGVARLFDYAAHANKLLLRSATGAVKLVPLEDGLVRVAATSNLITAGDVSRDLVQLPATDAAAPLISEPVLVNVATATGLDAPSSGTSFAQVGNSFAYGTKEGVGVSTPAGLRLFKLPRYDCSNPSVPPSPGTTARTPPVRASCASRPLQVTADGAGNIWFVSTDPGKPLGVLSVQSYGG